MSKVEMVISHVGFLDTTGLLGYSNIFIWSTQPSQSVCFSFTSFTCVEKTIYKRAQLLDIVTRQLQHKKAQNEYLKVYLKIYSPPPYATDSDFTFLLLSLFNFPASTHGPQIKSSIILIQNLSFSVIQGTCFSRLNDGIFVVDVKELLTRDF